MVEDYWTATDVKDFILCQRIPWWKNVALVREPDNQSLESGREFVIKFVSKEQRRTYFGEKVYTRKKRTEVPVISHKLRIVGIADAVIPADDGWIIMERKAQGVKGTNVPLRHMVQAGIYAQAWEEMTGDNVTQLIYLEVIMAR